MDMGGEGRQRPTNDWISNNCGKMGLQKELLLIWKKCRLNIFVYPLDSFFTFLFPALCPKG